VTDSGRAVRSAIMISLCLALFVEASCKRELRTSTTPFPASNEVADWVRISDIRTFEAADLWKYIDGEAERYLKGGVQKTSTADYRFQNKLEATVDIYAMGNAEGAEKVLGSEPPGEAKAVQLGDSARLYGQSLCFRKGRYLVRIVAYEESPEMQQALVKLGRGIEQRLAR
jgi:uncharacterized protein DUF6599